MADITLSYKGSTIAEVSASGTTKLNTKGKFCEDDISLAYVKPSGSSYVKLAETEVTVNTAATGVTIVGEINIVPASDAWTSAHQIFVMIRDKAGKRTGYFFGGDSIISNPLVGSADTNIARNNYTYSNDGKFAVSAQGYGVYVYDVNDSGRIRIASRYSSTLSLTIDGTYKIEVFALPYPDNVSPFA